ncbi:MAG: hypothetical protein WBK10_07015 [Bacillota bacterium]
MTLAQIIRRVLIAELPIDHRLLDFDIRVRLLLHSSPPATMRALADTIGAGVETVRRSLIRLRECGWVEDVGKAPRGALLVAACLPLPVEELVADRLQVVRNSVDWLGQWLMRCWLDFLVAEAHYIDNSRPAWLKSPGLGRLELDRDYPRQRVGYEFQGQQHFTEGGPFAPDRKKFEERVMLDNIKAGICVRNRYRLIEVVKEDLTREIMLAKTKGYLPIANYHVDSPIERALTEMSMAYINS